ncbi:hypothetical protein F2P81_014432 [Scophthalmus maximus]|uniref:VWFC domain-containing protein n=1 Tax=Scophthalmus maximus TaxID=52904 RepID=A0A6A4SGT8_SCOMX|nr:hypothetical protein F2P81_014432 [Scophthalmus maximus]
MSGNSGSRFSWPLTEVRFYSDPGVKPILLPVRSGGAPTFYWTTFSCAFILFAEFKVLLQTFDEVNWYLKQNNTSWRPQSCQECTCYSDVAICRPTHCPNPQCDFQRHDSQWSPSQCSLCTCSRGGVSCGARPCPPLDCPGGQSPFTPAGECCPKCGRSGESCSWQGLVRRDGEEWKPSLCSRCVCSSGDVQCSVAECRPVACKPHENLVIQPGQCCPQCVSNPCLSAGKQYQGQTKVKRAGQCCDECAAAKGSCLYEGAARYHGDMWNATGCEFCSCSRGQVVCRRAECGRGSELVHLPGKCCPECSSTKPSCAYEGKSYKDTAQWTDGSCRECECRDARATCYLRSCPTCPPGSLTVAQEGRCCPECRQVRCHADCLSCSGSADHCESCRDPKAVLHLGRCLSLCPAGFYAEGRACRACRSTCSTCSSGWGCLSCGPPLPLLSAGRDRCLASCPAGSYRHDESHCRPKDICRDLIGSNETTTTRSVAAGNRYGVSEDCAFEGALKFIETKLLLETDPRLHFWSKAKSLCEEEPSRGKGQNFGRPLREKGCHGSCASCLGPSVSQCSQCPDGLLLHQGQCVEACGEGLYAQDDTCQNCHPSCRSCVGPLASDCLRCLKPEEALLPQSAPLRRGVCAAGCPARSFLDDAQTCRACHPSCSRCTGPSADNCTSCPSPSGLHEGRCDASCARGFFLRDGQCQECDWSCNACKGPLRTDCLQCMDGYVLQDGVCAQGCSPGSYRDGDRCLGCDEHCVECRGAGQCQRCRPPYAALRGQCALECGRNYFLDDSSHVCKPCSSDCALCDGVGRCRACRDRTYLIEGYCAPDCGHGYYGDQKTRTCHDFSPVTSCRPFHASANSHPPALQVNGSLLVPLGGFAPLSPSLLRVTDADSPAERLVFQLVRSPSNGRLVLFGGEGGEGRAGGGRGHELTGDRASFTWAELRSGRVQFGHQKDKARTGEFTLRVADPQMFSPPETVHVQAVSMQPPRVLTLAPLAVKGRGAAATVTKSVLQLDDPDNAADVLIMVLEPPRHGLLSRLHGDRALGRFKLEELSREQIQYVHDGSEGTEEDRAVLQVNDGHSYRNVLLRVHVDQKAADSPRVLTVPTTWVKEGGMVRLDRKYLQADLKGVGPDDIVYSILSSDGRPQHGEVVLVSMPADGPPEGWRPSPGDDRGVTATTSFTQQDVDDGAVWYRHFGGGADSDSFQFQTAAALRGDVQTFTIGVLPQIPGFPQLAPDCDLQITYVLDYSLVLRVQALEDRVTELTPSALSFTDSETPSDKLVYNVTKPLPHGQGAIEHRDRPYTPAVHFTQADVNNGKIVYRPPPAPSHLQELYQYSFIGLPESLSVYFTVSDGEHTTPELDFAVLLLSNHQQPPVFQVLDPLLEGDALTFSVSDGISMATTVVQVEVLGGGAGGDGPQRDPAASLSLEVGEKSSTVIRRSHVAYSDNASPDGQIRLQLVSVPMYGILTRSESPQQHQELREYSSFTMDDVNEHRISAGFYLLLRWFERFFTVLQSRVSAPKPKDDFQIPLSCFQAPSMSERYITSLETGSQPVTDIFHFVVYDGDNNRLDNQMCTITITSTPRRPPAVTVQEGGRVQLSTNHITVVSDLDTPRKDLLVWLVTPPKYGFIENTKRGGSIGGSQVVTPDAPFPVDDLTSDHIFYVQDGGREDARPAQDVFSFYISDGQSQTEAFNVEIDIQQSKEDLEPVVSVSSIHVEENSGVVITNSSISVRDQDTPENEILFTIVRIPSYGKLRRRQFYSQPLENGRVLAQGSTFTYQDVLDRLLVYTPETVSGGADEMGFTLTDGVHTHAGRLEFTMDVRRSEGPRMTVNRGLQLPAGSSSKITEQNLKGTDMDSDSLRLRYVLTKDPPSGKLQLSRSGRLEKVSLKGPVQSFTQDDVNKGLLRYRHEKGERGGSLLFKFNLVDPEGNNLIDQSFFISVLEDRLPPSVAVNKGLVLDENSMKKLTTMQLSASDQDSEPGELVYRITKQTGLGHLEHVSNPGTRIITFTQADLASRSVQYVHTSEEEKHADQFSFTVSDGTNEVAQTFYITVKPVDDSLPLLQVPGMRVQEGVRKTITEFELKATDADTEAESVVFAVVQAPRHGTIERTNNGQHYRQTSSFTMDDVYQNRVSYNHDGSNSLKDRFTFTVADGTNLLFMIVTAAPQKFKIDILPVDDGTPRIVTNLGLQWLEYMDNKATNLITKKELLTTDPDTDDGQLVYEVTTEPRHGFLESKMTPGNAVATFTQGKVFLSNCPSAAPSGNLVSSPPADINLGLIRYVLHQENVQETTDHFRFLVRDSKPNVVSDNVFHIQWSLISFEHKSYNVSEKAGTVAVTVKRTGNLNQYAIVLCRTEQGSATSSGGAGSRPGQQDYVEYAGQVQFDEREDTKVCTVVVNDDQVFEGTESFHVELSMPAYALLGGNTRAAVNVNDTEDEPTLQFDRKVYHVNESAGSVHAPVERKGDTSSTVSALCHTVAKSAQGSSLHALESGSDYKSRGAGGDSRVVFGPGVSMTTCDVKLIDDSEYELSEEFELVLSDASDNARVGGVAVAKVVIDGPNDASTVSLGNATFTFSEDAGTIEIPVLRHGSDLSSLTSVWCATRPSDPPAAAPGVDYIPSSKKVEFKPGKTEETCSLTIVDDVQNPSIEGSESFVVFLSSPQGAVLQEPYEANVVITDTFQDIPSMQFEKSAYTVKEKDGVLHIPVVRSGDLSFKSSVRCFTRTMSAMVMDDFEERRNADESRITFLQGEKVKNCTVHVNDDSVFEPEEEFQVHLGTPLGDHWSGAMVGASDIVTITITNDEDAPTIEFEQASYQVREPPGPDGVEVLDIKVIRRGDLDRTSKIRCSTRDGSAQSGVDYNPKSRVLKFTPGMDHILFKVEILSNEDREWHESFSLVLGPDDPVEAVLGDITTATVTILDQEAAGSLILPAPPIVVSLADYDHVQDVTKEGSKKTPSPGYPLVCVTPCDPHYPKYPVMKERCDEAGINQTQVHFSWEVAAPTDTNGARSPFETVTDTTPYTGVNHMVLDSIYFSRRFHVRCVAQARDKAGHLGTPLRSNIATIGTDGSICHTPVTTGTARGFQAQSFIATLKYLDVKHKEHPNRIHISVQIPHQDGMLPLVSTMPLHNLHFLLSESIYRQQHVCSNLTGFLDDVSYDSISLGPGYDRPYQFNPGVRQAKSIQLYKHLNLKSCIWTFDAYYDMTELIDVCGGSVTADFQVRDSAQSFLTVQVPLYVSYIYVTAPRGWASLEHHTEMEFSFFYDTVLWRTGIQTDSVLSARLQIIRIYIREDGRLVIEFKTHAKFRGQFVPEHHTLPGHKSHLMAPDHLGGIEFDMQLLWSAQTFDSPYQLWRATSSYSRKDYSGEYTVFLIPCTVQPTQPWIDPGDKALSCTAHAPEKFLVPIAFQQTNRPVPVVYSLNTEFQLCNNEKVFMLDPAAADVSMAEMDYKGAFSMGQTLYGRVLWNPEQNLNAAYKLQLEKVYLCTGRDGYVPFFDPTGTLYNEGPQYGCIQPNKHLKHRFLLLDRKQPDVCHQFFHDVPFEANFASDVPELQPVAAMPGVDGFTMKVDALYKVEAGHQWYLQVIYVISPESRSSPRIQRSATYQLSRPRRDLVDRSGRLTLDESLIYDNEGDQVKNGTNMKSLRLEAGPAATFNAHVGSSVGGGVAAVTMLVLVLLASCFLFRRCRRRSAVARKKKKKNSDKAPKAYEEYPLNTKVEVCMDKCVEKNFSSKHCTVRNVNVLNRNQEANGKAKVKQVNLEVKIHNNLNDGTEV